VDGVSPNSFLTAVAREVLRDRVTIFETKFQDLVTDRRYDVVLFSESLLFIPLEQGLAKALSLLNPGGHILITDIFRVPAEGKSPIGGGHELPRFRETVARFPLAPVTDFDMTAGIAPTFDIVNRATLETVEPAYRLILDRMTLKYPLAMRAVRWWFRKKIQRYEQKHFSGRRDGANFMTYKSYRLLLFRRTDSKDSDASPARSAAAVRGLPTAPAAPAHAALHHRRAAQATGRHDPHRLARARRSGGLCGGRERCGAIPVHAAVRAAGAA
jgi:hypothetical protein